jgi:polo-like kinase 1
VSSKENKALGTLEMMHEVLTSKGFDDAQPSGGLNLHQAEFDRMRSPPKQKATVWVVRYVDYTSKYGLGFLLNTGSAGVYFNDSTKIVLSPDGAVFQYIERRRKESSPSTAEHSTQTHLMSCYPVELQKKVTLLRHFRNYLVEQQKACTQQQDDGTANGDGMQNMPMVAHDGANSGASSSVKFGVSSASLRPSDADSMGGDGDGGYTGVGADGELPFLKKWVRTRHAILFRLSNRTVQVVFFDRSEILLSSEARMVTYVDKQGVRSEHTLEEVLQTGKSNDELLFSPKYIDIAAYLTNK